MSSGHLYKSTSEKEWGPILWLPGVPCSHLSLLRLGLLVSLTIYKLTLTRSHRRENWHPGDWVNCWVEYSLNRKARLKPKFDCFLSPSSFFLFLLDNVDLRSNKTMLTSILLRELSQVKRLLLYMQRVQGYRKHRMISRVWLELIFHVAWLIRGKDA